VGAIANAATRGEQASAVAADAIAHTFPHDFAPLCLDFEHVQLCMPLLLGQLVLQTRGESAMRTGTGSAVMTNAKVVANDFVALLTQLLCAQRVMFHLQQPLLLRQLLLLLLAAALFLPLGRHPRTTPACTAETTHTQPLIVPPVAMAIQSMTSSFSPRIAPPPFLIVAICSALVSVTYGRALSLCRHATVRLLLGRAHATTRTLTPRLTLSESRARRPDEMRMRAFVRARDGGLASW
jgi:hypothetical protein